jgi:hypothetical protein
MDALVMTDGVIDPKKVAALCGAVLEFEGSGKPAKYEPHHYERAKRHLSDYRSWLRAEEARERNSAPAPAATAPQTNAAGNPMPSVVIQNGTGYDPGSLPMDVEPAKVKPYAEVM